MKQESVTLGEELRNVNGLDKKVVDKVQDELYTGLSFEFDV